MAQGFGSILGWGEDPEKKKDKKPQEIEELSIDSSGSELEKQKAVLARAQEELRRREAELEEQFRARMRELEQSSRAYLDVELGKVRERLETAERERSVNEKALSREGSKSELLERQARTAAEQAELLRAELRDASAKAQQAMDQAAGLRRELSEEQRKLSEKEHAAHALQQSIIALERMSQGDGRRAQEAEERSRQAEERARKAEEEARRKTQEAEERARKAEEEARRKEQESSQRIQQLEEAARRAAAAPPPAPAATAAPPAAAAPASAAVQGLPAAPGQTLPPVPAGDLQQQFNEMTKVRIAPDNTFMGWTRKQIEDPGISVKVVQMILEQAARIQASDIHLEPVEDFLRVRFRIDGMLSEVLRTPGPKKFPIISRIRVMCGLDPEQGPTVAKPQEGRMVAVVDGREIDLRLSTFPTSYGDKAVLRLIYRAGVKADFGELGFTPETTGLILRLIQKPQGMILVTGPAGSGKSTTLYTILQNLNDPTRNIVTLEDPVEMKLPGVNQSSVQPRIGFSFADGLRSILRQDPNVIMVGEIRDRETAEIAMTASLTGHLLLTTLHTNSAAGAVTRLLDMGLEPYLVASSLSAVFAQRLVRRLCPKCREAYAPSSALAEELASSARKAGVPQPPAGTKFFRAVGCPACRDTGYSGRSLIFELLPQFPALRTLILQKAPLEDLQAAAVKNGMESLGGYGLKLVRAGDTSLEEFFRIVGQRE